MAKPAIPMEQISAQFAALDFVLKQLYSAELQRQADPVEAAIATQARAMTNLKDQLEASKRSPNYAALVRVSVAITKFYEELVQQIERGADKKN